MVIWCVLLILGAYLLGSVPVSYLMAKLHRGIDLRQSGTGQTGAGNLWRMTSWKIGLPVALFDFAKGLVMVWAAKVVGLDIALQLAVGAAAIIGHNWSVFLRFQGGRGIAVTLSIAFILPIINEITPWPSVAFFTILVAGTIILRNSPVPVLVSTAALSLTSWGFAAPLSVSLGFLAIFLILVIKRLTAPLSPEAASISRGQLLLNRLLFDRDINDRKLWMYRKHRETGMKEGPASDK